MAQKVALICAHAVSTNRIAIRASTLKRDCVKCLGQTLGRLDTSTLAFRSRYPRGTKASLIAARWRTLFIRRHLGSGDELKVKHYCRGQQDLLAMRESANGSGLSLVSGSPT